MQATKKEKKSQKKWQKFEQMLVPGGGSSAQQEQTEAMIPHATHQLQKSQSMQVTTQHDSYIPEAVGMSAGGGPGQKKTSKRNKMPQQYIEKVPEEMRVLKTVQKQISLGASSSHNIEANFLLGFSYHEDEQQHDGGYSNSYGRKGARGKRGGGMKNYRPSKDYSVQSAFKFIVKSDEADYELNLYDSNENVEWKDVVQVIFNMINASEVQCPICMESLPSMVVPRITKCGHIYCWPCLLQYLAYDLQNRTANWKRCPLCNDPIYKHELKSVQIVQSHYYQENDVMKFNLMVRSRGNIIVKDKALSAGISSQIESQEEELKIVEPTKLYTSKFPSQNELEYKQCRLLLSDNNVWRSELQRELVALENDQKLMVSS